MEPYELPLREASAYIRKRELSPTELIDSVLARIEATDETVGAFACVTAELARNAAAAATREISRGDYRGSLHGLPLAVKDLYDTAGVETTCSSRVRAGHVPSHDAVVVERLLQHGMVIVGKTNMHEFAFGGVTPLTRNPWNTGRIAGGSSGGSAAAVATGSCLVGLGTDTAGSIRIPATLCGTVGLKPTYGRVSKRGITPLSWSLDHAGPLTRHVGDSALVLNAIAGFDPLDPAAVDLPVPDYTARLQEGLPGLRVGVPINYFFDRVEDEVASAVRAAVALLEHLGAEVREVAVPQAEAIVPALRAICLPEASAYHQRSLRAKGDLYTSEVRTLLEAGELVLATDYIKGLRVRSVVQQGWKTMFDGIDVLVTPGLPFAAPEVGAQDVRWPDGFVEDLSTGLVRFTSVANLTGQPVLAMPVGRDSAGLPVGMQITGRPFDEATVLRVGQAYESAGHDVGRLAAIPPRDEGRRSLPRLGGTLTQSFGRNES